MNRKTFGKIGEELVEKILISNDFKILDRNKYFGRSEFDLIATKNNKTYVVEVKTRKSLLFGAPEESVTIKKLENYERCYHQLVAEYGNQTIVYVIATVRLVNKKYLINFIKIN